MSEKKNNHSLKKNLNIRSLHLGEKKEIYAKLLKKNINLPIKKKYVGSRHILDNCAKEFLKYKIKSRNNNQSLYYNKLSPGCIDCSQGKGLTISFTNRCTRKCFYCYQSRSHEHSKETAPFKVFEEQIYDVFHKGLLSSLAITGGEPLLLPDKVYKAVSLSKKITRNNCHVRLYTNADLLDKEILNKLQDSGLDEIRFGYNDNNINFDKILQAKDYISKIMVEMPVFPNAEEEVKDILKKLESINIFGVNLKEFNYPGNNSEEYIRRGYFLKNSQKNPFYLFLSGCLPLYPIAGSEEVCLKLIKYASQQNMDLSVHYCSINNKKYSFRNRLKNISKNIKNPFESISRNGLLKSLIIKEPFCNPAYNELKKNGVKDCEIYFNNNKKMLKTHPNNSKYLLEYDLYLIYYLSNYEIVEIKQINEGKI